MQLFWYVFLDSLPPVVILLSFCLSVYRCVSLYTPLSVFFYCAYLCVCLSVFLSVCVFLHPSSETEPFICLCLPLNGSTRLTLGPSLRVSINPSVRLTRLSRLPRSIPPSIPLCIYQSVCPSDTSVTSACASVRPSLCVCPSVLLSFAPSVCPFVCSSVCRQLEMGCFPHLSLPYLVHYEGITVENR